MNPETDTYCRCIRKQIESIPPTLEGLTDAQINLKPPIDGANSAYVIATHVLGNARAWVLGVACRQSLRRDRPAEFASSGSFAELETAAGSLSEEIESALAGLPHDALDQRLIPAQELWGAGEPHEISVREALAHVLEHASMHLGQIQLTRDMAIAEVST